MIIGIIREGKTPPDKRVALTPQQCIEVQHRFGVEIIVQPSNHRAYTDLEYSAAGITISEDLSPCEVLFGIKEVPIDQLIPNKTYFFFSHTYKKQPYNRVLLQEILKKKITLIDYEMLTGKFGSRLVAFGKYAGIVGAYNALRGWGEKEGSYHLKPAFECHDKEEMFGQLHQLKFPGGLKIVITGKGRVAGGALETLEAAGIRQVNQKEFLTESFEEAVFTDLDVHQYNKTRDGSDFSKEIFFANGEQFESDFMRFAAVADVYIACHFWDSKAPYIFTRNDAKLDAFNIKMVADISCDIDGPVATTLRASTIENPFYGYDSQEEIEVDYHAPEAIGVMAVDNLPCELPRDASQYFGHDLIENVLTHLFHEDEEEVIWRAMETKDGELTPHFAYLQGYVNEEE